MKKPPCRICRSRRYRRTDVGVWVCEYGHQLENYVEEVDDVFRFEGGMRQVKLKKQRKGAHRRGDQEETPRTVGETVELASCEAFQWLLWAQVEAMRVKLSFDPLVEKVVGELWTVFVSSLHVPIEESSAYILNSNVNLAAMETEEASPVVDRPQGGAEDSEEDAEQEFPVTANDETSDDAEELFRLPAKDRSKQGVPPGLQFEYSIVLCYLASIYLRYPYTIADFHRWTHEGTLPYLHCKDLLPRLLAERLQGSNLADTNNVPHPNTLYLHANRLLYFYAKNGIHFPALNMHAVLQRYQTQFCLADPIVLLTRKIVQRQRLDMQFPEQLHPTNPERHFPCTSLLAAVIVAVKLVYGLQDGVEFQREEPFLTNVPSCQEWLHRVEETCRQMQRTRMPLYISDFDNHHERDLHCYAEYCKTVVFRNQRSPQEVDEFSAFFRNIAAPNVKQTLREKEEEAALEEDDRKRLAVQRRPSAVKDSPAHEAFVVYRPHSKRFHVDYARFLHVCSQWTYIDPMVIHQRTSTLLDPPPPTVP